MSLAPGQRLGPYEIVSPIGAGGMGEVYKARDTRLDRIVAIKVSSAQFSERFEREARAIAALNHPNIATLYDVGPNYLVMEYVEGEPLRGPLPLDRVMQYAGQICDALDAAHKKDITHRDLKPANILVNKQGIKLLDFGLAKIREEQAVSEETISKALTSQGTVLGTPQYMAPEQVEGKEADARSDIFALGCVLYEMLTGRKAFEGKNASSIAGAILAKNPEPIPNLPPSLQRVISTCLAKDADERFQCARDIKHALKWTIQAGPAPVAGTWKWVAAALGATTLVLALLFLRPSPQAPERMIRFQIQAPEKMRFGDSRAAVSPDGRILAFSARPEDGGKPSLWLRPLDSTTPHSLPGTEGACCPFWSPDSRFLAFSADNKLKRIEVAGGTPQIISETHAWEGTWNEAGEILLTKEGGLIQRVAASGGVPADLLKPNSASGEYFVSPSFLPDGLDFLFTCGIPNEDRVCSASVDGKRSRKRVLEKAFLPQFVPSLDRRRAGVPGYLIYRVTGGSLVARPFDPGKLEATGDAFLIAERISGYSASPSGVLVWRRENPGLRQVTWLDTQGKTLGKAGTPEGLSSLSLSPDGKRVAVQRLDQSGQPGVWTLDLERGVFSRLTSGGRPLWSRRGSRIFFTRGVDDNIYSIGADGGNEELVLRRPDPSSLPIRRRTKDSCCILSSTIREGSISGGSPCKERESRSR